MLINKIKKQLSSQFIRNIGWLGGAELANRILRLGVVVILARQLSSLDYGLAAVVLTTNDLAAVFTLKYGIGDKLIQANEKDLPILCETAYWMNWILSGLLFIIQCIAAFPIAWFYGNSQIILPICLTALVYLTFPTYAVQAALIYRENRLNIPALCNLVQSIVGNIFTVALALLGFGMWSIVLPILLTAPIWIVINRKNHPWRPKSSFTLHRWQEIAGFSLNLLGIQLLNKLRANLDYLLVGPFLGINALGVYYFAFNAGLGISLNIIMAFTWSLFPHLCAVREDFMQFKKRYFSSLKTMALIIIPLALLQAGLAPFYVPLIFGNKWVQLGAIPVLALVCLSAIPRPFAEAASLLLQAVDKTRITLLWNLIFTGIFAIFLLVAVKEGIIWVAASVLIAHCLFLPMFTVWASRYVFSKN
jgi:O-antigen/teichoic acid export membrane protein